jgi:hypothetical protein
VSGGTYRIAGTWHQKLAAGGMLVGEEVTILIDASAVRT